MIFTIGHRESYDRGFRETPKMRKVGRRPVASNPNYPGGSVWRTREEAQSHLDSKGMREHAVYGVVADWERDTAEPLVPNAPWRDLLVDADLVQL